MTKSLEICVQQQTISLHFTGDTDRDIPIQELFNWIFPFRESGNFINFADNSRSNVDEFL